MDRLMRPFEAIMRRKEMSERLDPRFVDEIKRTIERMVEEGTVEIDSVDEDGNFCYSLTEKGRKLAKKIVKKVNEK